jgi:excinuclease UvrABC ATPase subunit
VSDSIIIRGAREHNLKDISPEIPRGKLVVINGLSILKPNSFSAIVRCPVLEIGKNSVNPSMKPKIIASIILMPKV